MFLRLAPVYDYDKLRFSWYSEMVSLLIWNFVLRQIHLNSLIRTNGVVVSTTGVLPKLYAVRYDCDKCGEPNGPFYITGSEETMPKTCIGCQSRGPFSVNSSEVR